MPNRQKIGFHFFIKFGILPACIIAVVLIHFYNIQKGLSPWKGGGFGMYNTYHPIESQLYVDGVYINNSTITDQQQKTFLRNYLYYPNKNNLAVLIASLGQINDTLHIQIWKPQFDAKTSTYSRILKYECNYIKPRHTY
jgi:hypothetical protein